MDESGTKNKRGLIGRIAARLARGTGGKTRFSHETGGKTQLLREWGGKTRYITHAALIAAVYAALTILLAPISFGQQQIRVAEALTILPAFTPAAIPGLFIGCAIANTMSFMGLPDLIFGSLATLLSAQLTYMIAGRLRERGVAINAILLPLPAVIVNMVVIGAMLALLTEMSFWIAAIGVAVGQILSCYGLGAPLFLILRGYTIYEKKRGAKEPAGE